MKKFITILALALISLTGVVAVAEDMDSEVPPEMAMERIDIEDTYASYHPKAKKVQLWADYTPETGEVRFYYKCLSGSFDLADAIATTRAWYEEFMYNNKYKYKVIIRETESNQKEGRLSYTTYFSYRRLSR